ncbi:MAG: aminotransferase class I/II-fold pyridoxal phosphate-dependent enzyme [Candidatus Marinimicrobia bacterium]|nr:aminotransferase class I/II-fold pyridoxal phosphate-dependent enzyme [Candidatus Neomarinimicrobiota bacterium]
MKNEELRKLDFKTRCVHGAGELDPTTGAISHPIYQSSTFAFHNAKEGADLFTGAKEGFFYTRLGNPTQKAFENEICCLEDGEGAIAFGSGMAAISGMILGVAKSGENIVSSDTMYGGTHHLYKDTLPGLQIEVRSVDASDPDAIENAIDDKTRLLFIESPANPTMKVIDIQQCVEIAHKHDVLFAIDNTFATPYFQQPFDYDADLIVHSATKYIGGHGDVVAGVLIGRDPELLGSIRGHILRDIGGIISPLNAWLLIRGLKTLPVRMEAHQTNAMKIADYLENHTKIDRVWYPGLTSHPQHELAKRQMSGFSGMLSFQLKGAEKAAMEFMNGVKLITLAVSLGDIDTLMEHPASMTHHSYGDEELAEAGISKGLLRLSVGLEDVNDIIADLDMAFENVTST